MSYERTIRRWRKREGIKDARPFIQAAFDAQLSCEHEIGRDGRCVKCFLPDPTPVFVKSEPAKHPNDRPPLCVICGATYEAHWYWGESLKEQGRLNEYHDFVYPKEQHHGHSG